MRAHQWATYQLKQPPAATGAEDAQSVGLEEFDF